MVNTLSFSGPWLTLWDWLTGLLYSWVTEESATQRISVACQDHQLLCSRSWIQVFPCRIPALLLFQASFSGIAFMAFNSKEVPSSTRVCVCVCACVCVCMREKVWACVYGGCRAEPRVFFSHQEQSQVEFWNMEINYMYLVFPYLIFPVLTVGCITKVYIEPQEIDFSFS